MLNRDLMHRTLLRFRKCVKIVANLRLKPEIIVNEFLTYFTSVIFVVYFIAYEIFLK